jgi:catechol 2,3-dioxygenase-like lactoylglutathione lyase family enzyme
VSPVPPVVFDHIAIAVARMADAPAFLVGTLGGVPDFGWESGGYRFGQWTYDGGGRIEILEPLSPDSFLHRFLAARGPGVHHVTFKVPSLPEACDRVKAHGYAVVGYSDRNRHWKEAFLHPKDALGVVVQIVESDGTRPPGSWQAPPGPADPPPPVAVLGLRTRARSVERARLQWGDILQGTTLVDDTASTLVYGWSDSPMRIVVDVDAAADEGSVAIEITASRPVALPAGPHPVLGAVFSRR